MRTGIWKYSCKKITTKSSTPRNAGTIISFRIGTKDAMHMAKEMYPEFDVENFINLANYRIYLKLMIDGKPSRPFSGITTALPYH